MAIAELGACEWFAKELRRSGLVDQVQLDRVLAEFMKLAPRAEPKNLADFLVERKLLSAYQADRLLTGKAAGLVLGPYSLIDAIGQGSMGKVYKAISKNDRAFYAVKVLPRRSMWNVRMARRQVRAFGQFDHPSVVPFVDVGTAGGLHYLAWPFVEGESLEARVNREGKLAPGVAALFALQIAHGLSVAYQNGLFHGLMKPSNVLIGPDQTARVLDFGIGSLLVENEGESIVDTMSTANVLTSGLDCSSPECILDPKNRTTAGDQYSLGCMLYFALAGRYPFADGSAVEKIMAHQAKEPPPITQFAPDVPEGLCGIVTKLMAKQPKDRYALIEEIVDALEPFAIEPSCLAGPSASMETPIPQNTAVTSRAAIQAATEAKAKSRDAINIAAQAATQPVPWPDAAKRKTSQSFALLTLDDNKFTPAIRFSPLTLVLAGMALVCMFYLALNYFHILN
jgi:serine/threonine-protein kinase